MAATPTPLVEPEGLCPSDLTIGLAECVGGTGPVRGSSAFAIVPAWHELEGTLR